MHESKQKTASWKKEVAEEAADGTDLRDEKLAEDADAMLDEIDCCLAANEAERKAAERRKRLDAKAEWLAIEDEHARACYYPYTRFCTHKMQRRVWQATYGHLFETVCCGAPVFPDEGDE